MEKLVHRGRVVRGSVIKELFKDPARLFDFCFGKKFYPLLLEKTNRNIQMIYDANGPDYKPGQVSTNFALRNLISDDLPTVVPVGMSARIPDKGKDEFMVTGECLRKWIGISYLMVLYMGEHDTKEIALFLHTICST